MTNTTTNGTTPVKSDAMDIAHDDGLRMVVSPAEALKRVQELQAFVAKVMVPGTDFGVIPGTQGKPSLFQPGAQKLCELYGFAPSFEDIYVLEDWERPLFVYRKKCVLTLRRDGRFIGNGVGSCNSREDRYAWRWVKEIPKGVDPETVKSKDTQYGKRYRFPNDDIYSLVNTIEKMAAKRSLIHAVIGATRSAGMFTQDVEDLPRDAFGAVSEQRSWEVGDKPTHEPALAGEFDKRIATAKVLKDLKVVGKEIGDASKKGRISPDERGALLKTYNAAVEKLSGKPAAAAAKPEPEVHEAEVVEEGDRGDNPNNY